MNRQSGSHFVLAMDQKLWIAGGRMGDRDRLDPGEYVLACHEKDSVEMSLPRRPFRGCALIYLPHDKDSDEDSESCADAECIRK